MNLKHLSVLCAFSLLSFHACKTESKNQFSEVEKIPGIVLENMDTSVNPQISYGVTIPYSQKIISETGTWSADGKIYTVNHNVTLDHESSSDGINLIVTLPVNATGGPTSELFNTTEGIVDPTPGVVKPVIVEVGTDVTFHPYVVPLLISDVSTIELILLPEQIV